MRSVIERVHSYVRELELLRPGDRVAAAVSGGADSIALVRLLLELRGDLGLVLSVVHFNHQIRGAEADADQRFVEELARKHDLELHASSADTPGIAAAEKLSLEAAARRLRYDFFQSLMGQGVVNKVATAHTLDDQAETVVLRIVRGTGTRGLGGILPKLRMSGEGCGTVVRPLLNTRRAELREYLTRLGQTWREDASNLDLKHMRNRVRQVLLPLLEREFTPVIATRLNELAEIARAEEEHWDEIIAPLLALMPASAADVSGINRQPLAIRRRLVRALAEEVGVRLEFEQVGEILSLIDRPRRGEKKIELGEGWCVERRGNELSFRKEPAEAVSNTDYEYRLPIPGQVRVYETSSMFKAATVGSRDSVVEHALKADALPPELLIRNWRPGDRFWPAHTKAPKKIKELLQQRHIPPDARRTWPVIAAGPEIVWVRGWPPASNHIAGPNDPAAMVIEEIALADDARDNI